MAAIIEKLNYKGIWYNLYKSQTPTNDYILFFHGSGEWGPADGSQLSKVEANGLTKYLKAGMDIDWNVIAPQATQGSGAANYDAIRTNIVDLVKTYNPRLVVATGLSQGGEVTAGFLTNSCNGGQTISAYKGSAIFDGYVIVCGQPPGIPNFCANPDKPVLCIHAVGDSAISIWAARKIVNERNKCSEVSSKAKIVEIAGGSHSTAWIQGYAPTGYFPGQEFYGFLKDLKTKADQIPPTTQEPEKKEITKTWIADNFIYYATSTGVVYFNEVGTASFKLNI